MKQSLAGISIILLILLFNVKYSYAAVRDIVPNATPTPTESPTNDNPPSPNPTTTPSPSATPTPQPTSVPTSTPSITPTPTTTVTLTPTKAPITPTPTAVPTKTPTATPTPTTPPSTASTTSSSDDNPPTSGIVQAATVFEKILGISTNTNENSNEESLANKVITAPIDLIASQFSKEYYANNSISKTTSQRLLLFAFFSMVIGIFLVQPTLRRMVMKQIHKLPKEGVIFTRFRYLTSLFF